MRFEVAGTDPDGETMGAFVNVVVVARSEGHAHELAAQSLHESGFSIVNVEDASEYKRIPFADRLKPRLKALASRARRTGRAQCGPFYTWPNDAED